MRLWIGPIFSLLFLCPWILGNSECNAFSGTADKTADAALMYEARQKIDKGEYSEALTSIARMTAINRDGHDGRILEASAYAGLCGLNLVTFATHLSSGISTTTLMALLLTEMKAATSYANCVSAETLLQGIPAAQMTSDDWVFFAFVEFAKMGAALEVAQLDSPAHSGTVNTGFNTCTAAAPLTDAIVADIGLGIALAITAITNSGISLGPSGLTALCGAPINYPCGATSAATILATPAYITLIRTLMKTNEMGLNICGGAVGSSAPCAPCP